MWCPNVVSLSDHTVVHKIAICYLQMLHASLKCLSGGGGGGVRCRKRGGTSGGRGSVRSGAGTARGLMGCPQMLLEVSTTWERMTHPKRSTHTPVEEVCVWAASVAGQIAARLFHCAVVWNCSLTAAAEPHHQNTPFIHFHIYIYFFVRFPPTHLCQSRFQQETFHLLMIHLFNSAVVCDFSSSSEVFGVKFLTFRLFSLPPPPTPSLCCEMFCGCGCSELRNVSSAIRSNPPPPLFFCKLLSRASCISASVI